MVRVAITGTGLWTPPHSISNEELVDSFNAYVRDANDRHANLIEAGQVAPLQESDPGFILKASGIRSRYVLDREGILDPFRMKPFIPERPDDRMSVQCEMSMAAAREAMAAARRSAADFDGVIVACSNLQRAYPAIAVEVQSALGIEGWAYDMNVACSSATFGIQNAVDAIRGGHARAVLMVNPEICSAHLNFRDRDSHFIFGDACTAVVIEPADSAVAEPRFEIVSTRLRTVFSNNIRNNFGFLNRCDETGIDMPDKLFVQNGRSVFKEVVPMVASQIASHLQDSGVAEVRRLWLHQANLNMNLLVAKRVLGREPTDEESPTVLDEYANTSSAGSIIAFHRHHADLRPGDAGVICSFGAGYSVGTVIVRRI